MKIADYQKAKLIVDQIDIHMKELDKLYTIKRGTSNAHGEKIVISTTGSQAKIEFEPYFVNVICEVIDKKILVLKAQLDKL